jgi:hypothetical protein
MRHSRITRIFSLAGLDPADHDFMCAKPPRHPNPKLESQ